MSFKTRRLPCSIRSGDLSRILSVRDNKLTYLKENYLYVVRSGDDPRAWRKKVNQKGDGIGPWEHCRPDCDGVLRSPSVFELTRQDLIEEWQEVRSREQEQRANSKNAIREPIWKRGRRAHPEMRTLEMWAWAEKELERDEDIQLPRRFRTDIILEEDEKRAVSEILFTRYAYPRLGPMVPTAYLLDQHYLLRRLIRLNWISRWASGFSPGAIQFLEDHQFSTRRWHLLNLWMRVPEGRELFNDLPQLAWLLASSWNFKRKPVQRPLRSLRTLVKKPRVKLLAWMDLPGGKGTLKVLRRIEAADMSPKFAYWLREALRDEQGRSWLQNMDGQIQAKILYLVGRQQPITFPIVAAIAKKEKAGPAGATLPVSLLYFHIRKMLRELDRDEEIERLRRVHSVDRLREWHDQLIDELNWRPARLNRSLAAAWEEVGEMIYPPLQPTEAIQPLTSHEAIAEEGIEMRHCIASFSAEVAAGSYYVYTILLDGERATIGLRCGIRRVWRLDEMRGKRNAGVSVEMKKHVREWIKASQAIKAKPVPSIQQTARVLNTEWIDESEYANGVEVGAGAVTDPF